MPPSSSKQISTDLIEKIENYSSRLPPTIPEATTKDLIFTTMKIDEKSAWETFNRRFDILFKEDKQCRVNGRLHHIRGGRKGMAGVVNYLKRAVDLPGMQHVLMNLKLTRLADELSFLCDGAQQPDQTSSTTPNESATEGAGVPVTTPSQIKPSETPVKEREPTVSQRGPDPKSSRYQHLDNYGKKPAEIELPGDSVHDKTYKGGVANRNVSEEPILPYNLADDGFEEIPSDTEKQERSTKQKRVKRHRADVSSSEDEPYKDNESDSDSSDSLDLAKMNVSGSKKKRKLSTSRDKKKSASKPKAKKAKKKRRASATSEISDEDSSDGESALREVRDFEASQRKSGVRGPENRTLVHWHDPPKQSVDNGGAKRWTFSCKYCPATRTVERTAGIMDFYVQQPRPKLTNLATHIKEKHLDKRQAADKGEDIAVNTKPMDPGVNDKMVALMRGFVDKGIADPRKDPTRKGFLWTLTGWLVEDDLPFKTGESPGLQRLFDYIQVTDPMFKLPSDSTVRTTLDNIVKAMHNRLVKELSTVKSKIAYSTDTWTNKQMIFTFAGTVAFFIDDDWCIQERLIDFHHLDDHEHAGIHAAKSFVRSASARGGLNKMSSLTLDNCSVNDVLARTLRILLAQRYDIHFSPENGQIRCLAHIINLVVQMILSVLDEAEDPDQQDYYEFNKTLPIHYTADDDEELQDLESSRRIQEDAAVSEEEEDEDADGLGGIRASERAVLSEVGKIRLACKKITASPQRRAAFRRHAATNYRNATDVVPLTQKRISTLMPKKDVRHRWNWTHEMIERGILMSKAINGWIAEKCGSDDSIPILTASDWEFLRALAPILKMFTDATSIMSQSKTPTLPWVLPTFFLLQKSLDDVINNSAISIRLRDACAAGLTKLDGYFELAKQCHSNVLATMLHPGLRNTWFLELGEDAMDKAEVLFRHVYTEYKKDAPQSEDTPDTSSTTQKSTSTSFLARAAGTASRQKAAIPQRGEVERWFDGEGGECDDQNLPLVWWRAHASQFPVISRMARDFLAIPGSSVAVERLFSGSRQVCVDTRSSLKAQTITELMCARQWIKQGLLQVEYSYARTGLLKKTD